MLVDLGFKVTEEFRRRYKAHASRLGISMKRLLEEGLELHEAVAPVDLTRE